VLQRKQNKLILWFDELGIDDVPLVGGKNASLGEMYRNLTKKGVRIPNGFAVTAHAYDYMIESAGIKKEIMQIMKGLNTKDIHNLSSRGKKVREVIKNAEFPEDLKEEIVNAYRQMCKQYRNPHTDVAVRSSATAEDLPDASFAGQQETYLNITGEYALLDSCKKCFASLFTNRAISYREDQGFDHFKVSLSIGVQKMVRSDQSSSGIMFSLDTESGFKDVVLINSCYGLGENIVQGAVNPDEFYVFKPTLHKGFNSIISRSVGRKAIKMIYGQGEKHPVKNVNVPQSERVKYAVSDKEILTLAKWACIIEDHYSKKAGHHKPMDMEWAKDGPNGILYIVQARPETVASRKDATVLETHVMKQHGKIVFTGRAVGDKIGSGRVHVIKDVKDIHKFKDGEVLITEMTDPDWEPIMKKAAAIVTNRGGRTCHAAIISRELGIPCIVGTIDGTEKVKSGDKVTVSSAEGDVGKVYKGMLKHDITKVNLKNFPKTKTKVMLNLGNPEQAFELSFLPNQGVGLAREEFIINSYIKIHPLALINYDTLRDRHEKAKIKEMTAGYTDKKEYFIDKLAQGVARIAAAFYPNDVIVRMSDFKSNEYANLVGGRMFEPTEDNPMIGWRGASRYYNDRYKEAFGLECKAMHRVRHDMGLKNLKVMVPFCRTVDEGKKVVTEMKKHGLVKGKDGLEVYVMCEIPSNVVLAEEFAKVFDGFSIGSNDLTQLTLGLDRDSEIVSSIFDERNEAVKKLVSSVIKVAKSKKKKIGICGDAPSTYPDFAQFLVKEGIDSISLSPDAVVRTTLKIAEMEKKLRR
jgi:pyruvate,water dikinase